MSQPRKHDCNTHISHISRNKGNQTIKFGLLIENDMGNIFLQRSYTKWGGGPSDQNLAYRLINTLKCYTDSLFLLYAKLRTIETCCN